MKTWKPTQKKVVEKMNKFDEKMENYSKKTDGKMDKFLQTVKDSVGTQLLWKSRSGEPKRAHEDQNQGKAVVTGIHSETSESEVEKLLKETITEIGMPIENAKIECPAKPITHGFIYFKNDDERNKYVKSANMLRKEMRGRKSKITRSMDAEGRFHQKRMGYVKYCIHMRHTIPLNSISLNWTSKHVSVKCQIVVETFQSGSLKNVQYQDIESEVEDQTEKWHSKNSSQRL